MRQQNDLLLDVFKYYQGKGEPPYPAVQIFRINNEVLDVVSFALSHDEAQEYSSAAAPAPISESEALRRVSIILDKLLTRTLNANV